MHHEKRAQLRKDEPEHGSHLSGWKPPKLWARFLNINGTFGIDEFWYYHREKTTEQMKLYILMTRSGEFERLVERLKNMERTIKRIQAEKAEVNQKNAFYNPPIFYDKFCYTF
jgi:hypothetical protein